MVTSLQRKFRVLVLVASAWSTGALAAWDFVPNLNLSAVTQDNVLLRADTLTNNSTTSSVLDARFEMSTFNERGYVTFEPRARINAYSEQQFSALDGSDLFLRGRGEYEWQRATIGFRMDYRQRAVIRSELAEIEDPDFDDDSDLDDTDDVDTGRLIAVEQDQTRVTLRPRIDYQLSERSTFRFQASSTDVSYSGFDISGRSGFQNSSLSAGIVRRANERNQISATLQVDDYDSDFNGNSTESVGVLGRIDRRVSDLWRVDFSVGIARSDLVYQDVVDLVENASVDYSFDVRSRRRGERTQLEIRASHRLNPNASGFIVKRNQFRVYVNHELTQRLTSRIGFLVQDSQSIGDAAPQNDRDYVRAEVSFGWALSEKMRLRAGYNYTAQDFVNENTGNRSSDTIFIGIGYQGLSRPGAP